MTLAIGRPHEGGETLRAWPHEAGDWQVVSVAPGHDWPDNDRFRISRCKTGRRLCFDGGA